MVLYDTAVLTVSQSVPTTNQHFTTMDQSLPTQKNRRRRVRANWTWEETVRLIDYLEDHKKDIAWTPAQRTQFSAQEGLRHIFPALTAKQILRRIEHLSYYWVKKESSCSSTLYKHGWSAMEPSCSREILLSNPSNTGIPQRKERRSRMTEPETLTNWSLKCEAYVDPRGTFLRDVRLTSEKI